MKERVFVEMILKGFDLALLYAENKKAAQPAVDNFRAQLKTMAQEGRAPSPGEWRELNAALDKELAKLTGSGATKSKTKDEGSAAK